jgi:phosphoribosyl 1,2-cyclic phosphodiesterase
VQLTLLGVRGSTPAPGADFTRYGGHTSCVAITADDAPGGAPSLVLDAGTGIRDLPTLLHGRPFAGSLVLTHLHWDHVQGLPFCPSLDHGDARVDVWVPTAEEERGGQSDGDACAEGTRARRLMAQVMSPPVFPIGPDGLLGQWRFREALPGPLRLGAGDAQVTVAPIAHKGGITYGIRVDLDGSSLAYLPDHALSDHAPAVLLSSAEALVQGVDVLLHDGQYTDDEAATACAYGHATLGATLRLADRCAVGHLVLIHHAPGRTDAQLDALAEQHPTTAQGRPVSFGRQGQSGSVLLTNSGVGGAF